jgi:hypothetical protein
MYSGTGLVTYPMNEKLHTDELSILSLGAFLLIEIKPLREIFAFLQPPMSVRWIIIGNNVLSGLELLLVFLTTL